jgi:hypothetical protein
MFVAWRVLVQVHLIPDCLEKPVANLLLQIDNAIHK